MDALKDILRGAEKIVFLTGSGISQESGIATFRGKDGLWQNYDPMKLASPEAFMDDPKLVWSWYNDRRRKILAANPNPGHIAIANLQNCRQVSVTQNIDGLHHVAGSREVTELHGNIFTIRCTKCNFKGRIESEFFDIPPICELCGGYLRPDVVWFGEVIKQEVWNEAVMRSTTCDIMIIVGTSLAISPANSLFLYAKNNNATLIEVNPENSMFSDEMNFSIRKTAADGLPNLVSIFESVS